MLGISAVLGSKTVFPFRSLINSMAENVRRRLGGGGGGGGGGGRVPQGGGGGAPVVAADVEERESNDKPFSFYTV